MVTFKKSGGFDKTVTFLSRNRAYNIQVIVKKYAEKGLIALKENTPKDTGNTANSWSYEITNKNDKISIIYHNRNLQKSIPIAILLQYGHATKNGGWVEGTDYINPALKLIFEKITNEAWEEVCSL